MTRRHILGVFGSLGFLVTSYSAVHSTIISETMTSKDIVAYSNVEAGFGTFYVLDFDVPADVVERPLNTVLLEFYVDVALKEGAQAVQTPVIEILPLTQACTGEAVAPQFARTATSVRGLTLGERRKVLVDITDTVRGWIANPSAKHGLIIGSLTDLKNGRFTVRSDVLGDGVVAKVTFFCRD